MRNFVFLVKQKYIQLFLFELFKRRKDMCDQVKSRIFRLTNGMRLFDEPNMLAQIQWLGREIKPDLIGVVAFTSSNVCYCSKKHRSIRNL